MLPDDDYDLPTASDGDGRWRNVSPRRAFLRGMAVALTTPGVILFASAAGFGALARDAGFSVANAVYMMAVFFALPAQVVMLDQIARGASVWAGTLAVSLTGLRLLPMSVLMMPLLKGPRAARWRYLVAGHFIAVTAWMEGWRRLPDVPVALRMDHFIGIGCGLVLATLAGTFTGYEVAGNVPTVVAAALLFLTPIYFLLSLMATASGASDGISIALGAMLGPPLYILAPGMDLLLAGLIGGTIAHVLAKAREAS